MNNTKKRKRKTILMKLIRMNNIVYDISIGPRGNYESEIAALKAEVAALKAEMEKEDTDKLKDELIKFKKWFESLPPASKFGGSYWIHNLTDAGLINIYLSKTQ